MTHITWFLLPCLFFPALLCLSQKTLSTGSIAAMPSVDLISINATTWTDATGMPMGNGQQASNITMESFTCSSLPSTKVGFFARLLKQKARGKYENYKKGSMTPDYSSPMTAEFM